MMFTAKTLVNILKSGLLIVAFLIAPTLTRAGDPAVWEMSSRVELLKGEAHGVSVTDNGTLMLAPRFDQLFNSEQPYIWSTATDAAAISTLARVMTEKSFASRV